VTIFDIPLSASDLWLLGIAGTLISFLAGVWVADHRAKMAAIRPAVHSYKCAFAPEIAAVSNGSYTIDTFSAAFQRHEAAVNAIRPLLSERYRRKLQKAWNEYCGKDTDLGLEPEEYVQAFNALLYSNHREMFGELKNRFAVLHGCLDDLL
jgi:hypothetical protein